MSIQVQKPAHSHPAPSPVSKNTSNDSKSSKGAHSGSLLDRKAPGDKMDLSTTSLLSSGSSSDAGKGAAGKAAHEPKPPSHRHGGGHDQSGAQLPPGLAKKQTHALPAGNPWKSVLSKRDDSIAQSQSTDPSAAIELIAPDSSSFVPFSVTQTTPLFQPAEIGTRLTTDILPMGQFVQDFVSDQMTEDPHTEQAVDQRASRADQAEQAATVQTNQAEQAQQAADAAAAQALLAQRSLLPQAISSSGEIVSPKAQNIIAQADITKRSAFSQSMQALDAVRVASEKASQAKASTQISNQMSIYH